jgi:HEPN domain-containing protein
MNAKINVVKDWIEKGDHDLGTAEVTYLFIPKFRDTTAFHCQQSVEKYLKAYLIFLEIPFKRVHSLNYLLSLINEKIEIEENIFEIASNLEDYAVEIRYPDTTIELCSEDIENAILIAKTIREFVLKQMKIVVNYDEIQ